MKKSILVIAVVGMLSGCISGVKKPDTYTDQNGKTTVIESDKEMCQRACNESYSGCMDSTAASTNDGIKGPSGVFGASGQCKSDLQNCLRECK
ncbi:MAG: hypothetical protein PHW76_04435 [Alphaproteobacteria bacterium]|nr:hypothetical protein [Alphaproteobacteria bacterium]